MIATEHDRKFSCRQNLFDFDCQSFAGARDLSQVLQLVMRFGRCLYALKRHVAQVTDAITEPSNALVDARHSQNCRPEFDAGHVRSVTEGHTEDANRPPDCLLYGAVLPRIFSHQSFTHSCDATASSVPIYTRSDALR